MAKNPDLSPARRPRAARFWALLFVAGMAIGGHGRVVLAAPSAAGLTTPANSVRHPRPHLESRPTWTELTPAQQQALAPLASEWDKLDGFRKHKWLVIGKRFSSMKPEEQRRLQERMRDWAKLTPEQRRLARESYARAKRLNQAQKSAQWAKYQQLPAEQRRKLAATAARKHVVTLPPPSQQARNHKTIPPIKAAPKRLLEQSLTPKAASQTAAAPPARPAPVTAAMPPAAAPPPESATK